MPNSKEYNKKYYSENKDTLKERARIKGKKRYRDNPRKHSMIMRKYKRKIRLALVAALGGKCVRCGFDDERALQVDHVNGGGVKEARALTGMKNKVILDKVLKGSEDYQLLCANCNWIKRVENNETSRKYF